jgi:protein dithiol:quinone oxidoreductase
VSGLAELERRLPARAAAWLLVLLPLAAVGAALVTQHLFGMLPCPWCVLQRLVFVAIALVALPAALASSPGLRRASAAAAMLLAGLGAAAALWQHFVASSAASCNLTLADRVMAASGLDQALPAVFAAWASCADAAVTLLGLPYEAWSLMLFLLIEALALRLLLRPGPRAA